MSNVKILKMSKNSSCNLLSYSNQKMDCPVVGKRKCYFIPLSEIQSFSHNPARAAGTQSSAVSQIFDSLITDIGGQLEPISVEWNQSISKFDIVFGCHREWAINDAYAKGFVIANHPSGVGPGIWAWVFTGSPAERTAIQMKENGDKKPSSPATKSEMVTLLSQYIAQGGLDFGHKIAFANLSDKDKYNRARTFMKKNTPFWGGRKFKGVWNALTLNGSSVVSLSYTTFSKAKLAEYFCNNNPYGIQKSDLDPKLSGSVVVKNGVKYGIYFVTKRAEIGGALPTNASNLRAYKKIDHMILVSALNDSTQATVSKSRTTFENKAKNWNSNIFDAFDEIFWMPQTKSETSTHILAGTWVSVVKV
jgi:hypothetical protein|tara:strand:+ start:751 stop:1836 length:1086 start_codon:yes stop_codon:yes gene_type:complete